jgi:protein-S-isoprenylcysteine O-methyltransferase Ste14
MYVGVMIMLAGEALFFGSWSLLTYAVIVFAAFNLFVILYEEPYLRKEFGTQYDHYRMSVRRWIPGAPYKPEDQK